MVETVTDPQSRRPSSWKVERGLRCKSCGGGGELWNERPFDKEVPGRGGCVELWSTEPRPLGVYGVCGCVGGGVAGGRGAVNVVSGCHPDTPLLYVLNPGWKFPVFLSEGAEVPRERE